MTLDEMLSDENQAALAKLPLIDLRIRRGILRQIAAEYVDDPRLTKSGGVLEQIRALEEAIARQMCPPSQVIGLKTLSLHALRG